uniref:Uncharacterized protein n=1 Tax=Anguilla anguilla TaxID=7936 RepID=A0A0E9SVZ0_ANGAN
MCIVDRRQQASWPSRFLSVPHSACYRQLSLWLFWLCIASPHWNQSFGLIDYMLVFQK